MKRTVVVTLNLFLRPFSATAFSLQPSTQQPLLSLCQSPSLKAQHASNGFDLDGVGKEASSEHRKNGRFRPRQLASIIFQAVVSTVPAIHRRIWSVPRDLWSRIIAQHQASAKLDAETAKIEQQSQQWILRTVVGLNLCPFALVPLKNRQVDMIVVRGKDENEIGRAVVGQLLIQKESPSGCNSFVVAPDFYPDDFYGYLRMVQYLEEAPMKQLDLHGHVQIAPFHPQFVFDFKESTKEEGETTSRDQTIDNYVNRSPYPMFHVLKQDDVDKTVETSCGGDPGTVWRRNVKLLRKIETIMGTNDAVDFLLSFATRDETPEAYPEEIVSQAMKEIRQDDYDTNETAEGMVRGVWEI